LLGIPALFLAGVEELISEFRAEALLSQGLGTLSAFVFSYLSIDWLIQFLQRSSTWLFIVYRIGFGLFIFLGLALGFPETLGWVLQLLPSPLLPQALQRLGQVLRQVGRIHPC
jgi:hypothetical protein